MRLLLLLEKQLVRALREPPRIVSAEEEDDRLMTKDRLETDERESADAPAAAIARQEAADFLMALLLYIDLSCCNSNV